MEKKPLTKDVLTENTTGIGPVTRERIHARARELALIAGHDPPHVSQVDYEQAKRELADRPGEDSRQALLESMPESKRWDPVPGSAGHQAPESPGEDEDAEGRSESEQLVDEGVEEAARDQMLQATRAAGTKHPGEP